MARPITSLFIRQRCRRLNRDTRGFRRFDENETPGPLSEVRLCKGDIAAVGLIGTVLTLVRPQDITLQELLVEMFMPADEASEGTLAKLAR